MQRKCHLANLNQMSDIVKKIQKMFGADHPIISPMIRARKIQRFFDLLRFVFNWGEL